MLVRIGRFSSERSTCPPVIERGACLSPVACRGKRNATDSQLAALVQQGHGAARTHDSQCAHNAPAACCFFRRAFIGWGGSIAPRPVAEPPCWGARRLSSAAPQPGALHSARAAAEAGSANPAHSAREGVRKTARVSASASSAARRHCHRAARTRAAAQRHAPRGQLCAPRRKAPHTPRPRALAAPQSNPRSEPEVAGRRWRRWRVAGVPAAFVEPSHSALSQGAPQLFN